MINRLGSVLIQGLSTPLATGCFRKGHLNLGLVSEMQKRSFKGPQRGMRRYRADPLLSQYNTTGLSVMPWTALTSTFLKGASLHNEYKKRWKGPVPDDIIELLSPELPLSRCFLLSETMHKNND